MIASMIRSHSLQAGKRRRPGQVAKRLVAGVSAHLSLCHAIVQELPDAAQPLVENAMSSTSRTIVL